VTQQLTGRVTCKLTALLAAVTLVAAATVSVAGASPSGASTTARPHATAPKGTVVLGIVEAGHPIAGATVAIRNLDGSPIADTPTTKTLVGGAFAISAPFLPSQFQVVATDGRRAGKPFRPTLRATVDGYTSPETIYVNTVSTVVAAYLDRHPTLAVPEAELAVAKLLDVPADDPAATVAASGATVNQTKLLAAAEDHGGLRAYATKLAEQAAAGDTTRHFRAKGVGGAGSVAAWAFEALRARANDPECIKNPKLPKCNDLPFGDVLRFFASPTEKALADISNKLEEIAKQLADLQSVTREIKAAVDQNTYNNIVGFMRPEVVTQAVQTLDEVTKNCGKSQSSRYCATELGDNSATNPGALRLQIRANLIDSGVLKGLPERVSGAQGTTGVMDVWPTVVRNRAGRFFRAKDSKLLRDGFEYFYGLEVSAMTLATNYWRWEERAEANVQADINGYDKSVKAQQAIFSPLPVDTTIDLTTKRMWSTQVICGSASDGDARNSNPRCPETISGFGIASQHLFFAPYGPFSEPCPAGAWCLPTIPDMNQLLSNATGSWEKYLNSATDIYLNRPGGFIIWMNHYDCTPIAVDRFHDRCINTTRDFLTLANNTWGKSRVDDRNTAFFLFFRTPTEKNRYL
jgi:hypothetical protein